MPPIHTHGQKLKLRVSEAGCTERRTSRLYGEVQGIIPYIDSHHRIEQALEVKRLLQISELEDYFRDDCLEVQLDQKLSSQKTFIYSIILPKTTYIIVKREDAVETVAVDISRSTLEKLVKQWRC